VNLAAPFDNHQSPVPASTEYQGGSKVPLHDSVGHVPSPSLQQAFFGDPLDFLMKKRMYSTYETTSPPIRPPPPSLDVKMISPTRAGSHLHASHSSQQKGHNFATWQASPRAVEGPRICPRTTPPSTRGHLGRILILVSPSPVSTVGAAIRYKFMASVWLKNFL
jgi:hypothetical protein